jgi:endonuclease/exonuclease/phosphatase family metal-dependent hydrolase
VTLLVLLAILASPPASARASPFADPQSCAEEKGTLARERESVRIVSWNVRWFPDGKPGKAPAPEGTDIAWLTCLVRWLDADVIALQEIKRVPHAVAALARVAGSRYRVVVDDCADVSRQHLAFLYRPDRVRFDHVATRGEIDPTTAPHGTPSCPGRLRPALSAYAKSLRGGLDFHIADVHLDSGKESRDHDDRVAAWQRLSVLSSALQSSVADDDVIVLGDFNTMGTKEVSAAAEMAALASTVRASSLPFRVASSGLGCSEYYQDHGNLLDQVLISATMREADDARVTVSGICAELACARLDAIYLPALTAISDHCPVIIDIPDTDIDGR